MTRSRECCNRIALRDGLSVRYRRVRQRCVTGRVAAAVVERPRPPPDVLWPDLIDQVERGLRGAAESGEACVGDYLADGGLTGLRAQA
jgi:hypothetical protein